MSRGALAVWSTLALVIAGCSGGAPAGSSSANPAGTAAAAPVATPPTAPMPSVLPKEPEPAPALAAIEYDPKGRRDPFAPVSVAPQKVGGLMVSALKLAGVVGGRTLLALVEAPDGLGYILKTGDVLGDARVTDVTGTSVTFAVAGRPGHADTVTLRLAD